YCRHRTTPRYKRMKDESGRRNPVEGIYLDSSFILPPSSFRLPVSPSRRAQLLNSADPLIPCQPPTRQRQLSIRRRALPHRPTPGELPFRKLAAAPLNAGDRLLQARPPVEVIEHLLVAEGLCRLPAQRAWQRA